MQFYLRSDNGGGVIEATYTPPEGAFFICDGNWHDIVGKFTTIVYPDIVNVESCIMCNKDRPYICKKKKKRGREVLV